MKNLESSIIESISKSDIGTVTEETLELTLDSTIQDGILKEIPIVKYIVAISKGVLSIRDYLFVKKIVGFLNEIGSSEQKIRESFAQELKDCNKEEETGSHIIELIDKSFGVKKSRLIGKIFVFFLKDKQALDYNGFLRISEMIIHAYESDLKYFLDTDENKIGETGDEVEHLISLGFYEREKSGFGSTIMENRKVRLSTFGELFKQASE